MLPFRDIASGDALLLSGSGRSGTTWLAEVLAGSLDARLIFEPFRPGIVSEFRGINNRQYLRPGQEAPSIRAGVERVLSGAIRSRWTDRYNHRFIYRSRVIKAIRANLLIGWMLETFPQLRVIHVIRDPLATIVSQGRGGWKIDNSKFTRQPNLMFDYLHKYDELIAAAADTPEKNFALHWAIENHVPARQFASGRWSSDRFRIFSYEAVLNNREAMIEVLEFAGVPDKKIDWNRINKPSRVSRGKVNFETGRPKRSLTEDIVSYTDELVSAFELDDWITPA